MGCLKLSYYNNERVGLTVVRAGVGVNEKIARPDVTAAALFFRSGQQHTTVLNFLLLFGSSQKVGIVDEGRILHDPQTSSFTYEYHLRDHLGSTRVAFEPTTSGNEVKQINAYYPFGAPIAALSWSNQTFNPNRYQRENKEYISDFGWNKHDYGGRYFDLWAPHALSRDPLARKFYWISPYALFNNNPVKFIDSDGRWPQYFHKIILKQAFKQELKSGEITKKQLRIMIQSSINVDKLQKPEESYYHSMTDGTADQSVEEAQGLRDDYVSTEIDNFAEATDMDEAFDHLGNALHPMSDEDTPSHSWKPWKGYGFLGMKGLIHFFGETGLFQSKAKKASIEKVRKTYQEAQRRREEVQKRKEDEKRKEEEKKKEEDKKMKKTK